MIPEILEGFTDATARSAGASIAVLFRPVDGGRVRFASKFCSSVTPPVRTTMTTNTEDEGG